MRNDTSRSERRWDIRSSSHKKSDDKNSVQSQFRPRSSQIHEKDSDNDSTEGPCRLMLRSSCSRSVSEELPYQFIAPALSSLEDHAGRLFQEARLSYGSIKAYGTPRRLALVVQALAIHQTAVTKETMGPSKSVAFDQAGQPTKAAIGFATGQGVPVDSLQVRQTPKGEYLFAVKQDAGRTTKTVLLNCYRSSSARSRFPRR